MTTVQEVITSWINEQENTVDFIFISTDINFVNTIINAIILNEKIDRIVLPTIYPDKNIFSASNKIITTRDFGKNPKDCIFLGDFVNSNFMTTSSFDYFARVDREPVYRRYCTSVLMYNFIGTPPTNGFWVVDLNKNIINDTFRFYFLYPSLWCRICRGCPKNEYTSESIITLENVEVTQKWIQHLKDLIIYFVHFILDTNEYDEQIINDDNMACWIKGFIHETYNYVYSYDNIEFLGDGIFDSCMRIYMYSRYPRLKQGEASNYKTEYVSKDYMMLWAEDMKMVDLVLADKTVFKHTIKTKGDIFESFFASLYITLNSIDPLLGDIGTKNLTTIIGDTLTFEKKIGFGRDQHRVEQIFSSFGMANKYTVRLNTPGKIRGLDDYDDDDYDGPVQGDLNVMNSYRLEAKDNSFITFVTQINNEKKGFADIFKPYEFSPYRETQQDAKIKFWAGIANIFQSLGIDMEYVKQQKIQETNYIDMIALFAPDVAKSAKEKLALITKKDATTAAKLVQFKINKVDGYIIMYIHTDIVAPGSKLLSSVVSYSGGTNRVSDDYYSPLDVYYQIQNLSVVPFPLVKKNINGTELVPKKLGIYNAILQFVSS